MSIPGVPGGGGGREEEGAFPVPVLRSGAGDRTGVLLDVALLALLSPARKVNLLPLKRSQPRKGKRGAEPGPGAQKQQ